MSDEERKVPSEDANLQAEVVAKPKKRAPAKSAVDADAAPAPAKSETSTAPAKAAAKSNAVASAEISAIPEDAVKPAPKVKPAATEATADAAPAAPAAAAPKPTPAAPPKKAPPPPDPRVEEAKAKAETLKAAIVAKLGDAAVEEVGNAHYKPMVRIRKDDWAAVVEMLQTHQDWKLNYIECMAGTDYPDYIEIVLFVQSTEFGHFVCLKTRTARDNAEVPSLVPIYPGVNWEEREIYDLLGVTFTDHPDLRRIMMWDEFKGHPLRKDYSEWD